MTDNTNRIPGSGKKVDHSVEVNEMVARLRGTYRLCENDVNRQIYTDAADLLARTEAKRVELQKNLDRLVLSLVDVDPSYWNDGCDCCVQEYLGESDEWKAVEAALEAAKGEPND